MTVQSFRPIKRGLCQCGCGGETKISEKNDARFGWKKGAPRFYVCGHSRKGFRQKFCPQRIYFECKNCNTKDFYYKSQLAPGKNPGQFCTVKCAGEFYRKNEGTHPNYKGGWYVDKTTGYKRKNIWNKGNNYAILEHRFVMEKNLGRKLKPSEHVHHKNGIKADNRLENLELLTASEHILEHWKDEKYKARMRPVLLKNAKHFKKGYDHRRIYGRKPDAIVS